MEHIVYIERRVAMLEMFEAILLTIFGCIGAVLVYALSIIVAFLPEILIVVLIVKLVGRRKDHKD